MAASDDAAGDEAASTTDNSVPKPGQHPAHGPHPSLSPWRLLP